MTLVLAGALAAPSARAAMPAAPTPAVPVSAVPTDIEITLDKARILRMPQAAQTIVVGNPTIADITTLKTDGLVVVTGKGFGETNMIFLDKGGQPIEEAEVHVVASNTQLTVQRGLSRETYSCLPRCQPTIALGDDETFLKGASGQVQSRNALATPTSH